MAFLLRQYTPKSVGTLAVGKKKFFFLNGRPINSFAASLSKTTKYFLCLAKKKFNKSKLSFNIPACTGFNKYKRLKHLKLCCVVKMKKYTKIKNLIIFSVHRVEMGQIFCDIFVHMATLCEMQILLRKA